MKQKNMFLLVKENNFAAVKLLKRTHGKQLIGTLINLQTLLLVMDKRKILQLLGFVILCEIIGSLGAIFTTPNIPTWYALLAKPFFSPPNWIFAPVWTTLFLLMGIAIFLIWENKDKKILVQRKSAILWFAVQFVFNILWSFLFFGLKNPFYGFIGIIFLWVSIVITILSFYKINKKAAYLLIPYLLWVSFASILNYFVMILN